MDLEIKNNFEKFFFIVATILTFNFNLQSQELLERGRFSGYMFGDYYYNIIRDTEATKLPFAIYKDPKDQNGFQFRRIYFTYDYQISDKFSSRFRLEADQFSLKNNSKISVFVKDAYLQWKDIFKGTNFIFGIQPTPTFETSESIWENRHIEMTIIDLYGLMGSRDCGISLKGKLDNSGIFNYCLLFGNGSSNRPETEKYKTIYANFLFKPTSQIIAYLNYHHKFIKPSQNKFNSKEILNRDEDLFSLFLSYNQKDIFKVGVESFFNFVHNGFDDSTNLSYINRNMFGITFFGIYYISKKFNLVFRYDFFDPNTLKDYKYDTKSFYIMCLNYKPTEKVSISPSLLIEDFANNPPKKYKPSITSRIVFFFIF
ncbi:MAG: hypothetical protein N2560_00365 [Ignavibacteria bacterium]|nr:hypothetical protein [Ignavibacteria bacterium]